MDAVLERARLDLAFTRISAPISGIAGASLVAPGDLVTPTQILTTISTLDPIKARFTISENLYLKHAPKIAAANALPDNLKRDLFELIRANGSLHPHRGRLDFVDRQIQPPPAHWLFPPSSPTLTTSSGSANSDASVWLRLPSITPLLSPNEPSWICKATSSSSSSNRTILPSSAPSAPANGLVTFGLLSRSYSRARPS